MLWVHTQKLMHQGLFCWGVESSFVKTPKFLPFQLLGCITWELLSKLYKMRQQRYFFSWEFWVFCGFAALVLFVSTLELLHKNNYGIPSSPFFCSAQPFPAQMWALGCPAGVFTGVLGCSAESKGTNQERANGAERSRDNIALFSFCIPHPSHSSQEMLSLPLSPLHVSCQIFSSWLNPALEVWQMKRDTRKKNLKIGATLFSVVF